MSELSFASRFEKLTGYAPFPWQQDLSDQFGKGIIIRSLDIPTGLGKTAVMALWLVARSFGAALPRRLVYVVDRRAVVDQATEEANKLRDAVEQHTEIKQGLGLGTRSLPISTLRGQHVDRKEWLEDPASCAIIVGTIDMIGSRLLFEGYGVSRKMRPYHAGLLGADTLVVLDEAHLVPPFEKLLDAIASDSAKVAPRNEARAIVPQFKLMSLSATGRTWSDSPFTLTDKDLDHSVVQQRLYAKKRLQFKQLQVEKDLPPAELNSLLADSLADEAWQIAACATKPASVIVFCNKRKVAEAAKKALEERAKLAGQTDISQRTELFVGGRRVYEREAAAARLNTLGFIAGSNEPRTQSTFLFATSAGEVGVDLDADHMVCDLVEWERMIQRLGRVNRRGEGEAQVVILLEPDPRPDNAAKEAIAKDATRRTEKEAKAVEAHQRKVELARAKRIPIDHLLRHEDSSINASPGAIRELKTRASKDDNLQAILDAATSPEPLRPALTRPLVDAWSMTSLEKHTGRPEIGPWLRGWIEDDPPQTTVVWRTHLPVRNQGKVTQKEIGDFFEAAPPHISEGLETETDSVLGWLKKRAGALLKQQQKQSAQEKVQKQPIGFVLSPAGDPQGLFWLTSDGVGFAHASKRAKQVEDADKRPLWNATLIVDARLAGLRDGLLDASENDIPQTADDGQDWLSPSDGEPVIQFRLRSVDAELNGSSTPEPQWRTRLRFPTTLSEEGEVGKWLIVEKWRTDSTTEDDRSLGQYQLLDSHQQLAEARARNLAKSLNLPEPYAKMLAIAARLHDEGKKATRWQLAFNAPSGGIYAKTAGPVNVALLDGYRHEFSSIAIAEQNPEFLKLPKELQDLALHLIAAHHGFGRPVMSVSGCEDAPPSKLEARALEVALRFARLQQEWGPWGLAWWESLLRAADQQASRASETVAPEVSMRAEP